MSDESKARATPPTTPGPHVGTPPAASPLPPTIDTPAAAPPGTLSPIAGDERIEAVDALRGFCLLGILMVNMALFAGPLQALLLAEPWWPARHDRMATFAIRALAEGKFYALFSMLFGFGMAIQMQRARARGRRFVGVYLRRLLVLLAIGLLHGLLLWYGDILALYALMGFILLLFSRVSTRVNLIIAGVAYVVPTVLYVGLTGLIGLAQLSPQGAQKINTAFTAAAEETEAQALAAVPAYAEGSWAAIFDQRLIDLQSTLGFTLWLSPTILALFLLGLCVGRIGILHDPARYDRLLRWLAGWGLLLGLLLNTGMAWIAEVSDPMMLGPLGVARQLLYTVGMPLLSFGYAALIVRLMQQPAWQRRLSPMAAAGRMALTNYLGQTIICTTLFYSYGLGLFGKVGPAFGLLLVIAIYAAQLALSTWWLRRFRFGPLEWLWRSLTYARPQPMLR